MAEENKKDLNHEMFTNKDGYVTGGKDVEMTDPSETQEARSSRSRKYLRQRRKEKLSGTNMAWFSLAKLACKLAQRFILIVKN